MLIDSTGQPTMLSIVQDPAATAAGLITASVVGVLVGLVWQRTGGRAAAAHTRFGDGVLFALVAISGGLGALLGDAGLVAGALLLGLAVLPRPRRSQATTANLIVLPALYLVGAIAVSSAVTAMLAGSATPGIVVGFNVKVDAAARELAERQGVTIQTFDIIYKLTEWLTGVLEERRPRQEVEQILGAAKVLKFFSAQSGKVVLGGRVEEGTLSEGQEIRIMRRDIDIGRGKIVSLQTGKTPQKKVEEGQEFGSMIRTEALPAAGDRIEVVTRVLA